MTTGAFACLGGQTLASCSRAGSQTSQQLASCIATQDARSTVGCVCGFSAVVSQVVDTLCSETIDVEKQTKNCGVDLFQVLNHGTNMRIGAMMALKSQDSMEWLGNKAVANTFFFSLSAADATSCWSSRTSSSSSSGAPRMVPDRRGL